MTERNRNKRIKDEPKSFCPPHDDIPTWLLVFGVVVLLFLIF